MIIIHDDLGMNYGPRVYTGSVDRRKRERRSIERYYLGIDPPNYPLPVPMALANTMIFADQHCFTVAAAWSHDEPMISALLRS